jgi:small subunit ribosomal protein S5
MSDAENKPNTQPTTAPAGAPSSRPMGAPQHGGQDGFRGNRGGGPRRDGPGGAPRGGDRRGGPRREPRAKPEFDQKIIDIRRVTRVASGGRRFSFAVSLVAGDRKGRVGVGTGKGGDTALAVEKALRSAKKNMIQVNLTKSGSIAHEVNAKFSASEVFMMPAPGKGVVAGSSVRDVIELGGIKDITAKIRSGSKNKLNNARVAIEALLMVKKPKQHSK